MMEVPSTEWRDAPWTWKEAGFEAPVRTEWRPLRAVVHHTFTHFHLELEIWSSTAAENGAELPPGDYRWVTRQELGAEALPSVMRKVCAAVLG